MCCLPGLRAAFISHLVACKLRTASQPRCAPKLRGRISFAATVYNVLPKSGVKPATAVPNIDQVEIEGGLAGGDPELRRRASTSMIGGSDKHDQQSAIM